MACEAFCYRLLLYHHTVFAGNKMSAILYYIYDPMCSWCYAFQPVWRSIKKELPESVEVINVLGGLAPDDDEPMPESLQQTIQHHWQRIQQVVPGTEFNFDFWTACTPRRATYPACRAVIAAANQGIEEGERMTETIQHAYYRRALNPSDYSTLRALAEEMKLNLTEFNKDLESMETDKELMRQLQLTHSLQVRGFPSLVLSLQSTSHSVNIDYTNAETSLKMIKDLI